MKKHLLKGVVLLTAVSVWGCGDTPPLYKDASAPIEKRIDDLVGRMTIEEKAAQMDMLSANAIRVDRTTFDEEMTVHFIDSMNIGSIHDFYPVDARSSNELQRRAVENTRLGIPLLFIEEGLHGYEGEGATCFPVNIANAGTWDTLLMNKIGRAIAAEARSKGVNFLLSPNLDLGREPRWGRIEETFGEDVYLAQRMGVNMIKGMQGERLSDDNAVASEPKHYGVHGIPESGSNAGPVNIGRREARSSHLVTWEAAVREAGARGVMAAYHDLDGVPSIKNRWLLTEVLREEWGFDGMVVSDLGAIRELRAASVHATAVDAKDAVAQAVNAGLDMQFYDFPHDEFQKAVVDGVKDGSIEKEALDRAVSAILRTKFLLGLFDDPYTDESLAPRVFHSEEHAALALEAGRKAITMLKNEDNTLPLDASKIRRVALVGNLANISSIGGYSPRGARGETVYEALSKRFGNGIQIDLIQSELTDRFAEIAASALTNTVEPGELGLYGEYFDNPDFSGAPSHTRIDRTVGFTWRNLVPTPGVGGDNFSVRWTGFITAPSTGLYEFSLTSDDYGRLYVGGGMIIDNWGPPTSAEGRRRSAKTAQIHLIGGQKVPVRVDYLEIDEDASVDLKWRLVGASTDNSFFARMAGAAADADAVIVVLGETNQEVGEGKDRQNLNFNPGDIQMLRAARRSGKPVVAVMLNGRPLVTTPVAENADAILEAWFPGERGGSAVVDVPSGDYNPSGKLSVSIPREQGPTPIYYSRKPTSRRRYSDGDGTPLYPFGHGLSYSTFEYANMTVTPADPTTKDVIKVTVDVTNTSRVDGTEVVQLYVRDRIASVTTPVMALKGFSLVPLRAGETKTVTMEIIPRKHLWLIDLDMKRTVESGEFVFMVGASSADIKFTQTVTLAE